MNLALIALLTRLDAGDGMVHGGSVFVEGPVPPVIALRRVGDWTEVDVPGLAAEAERLGRRCHVLDEAIAARLGNDLGRATGREASL